KREGTLANLAGCSHLLRAPQARAGVSFAVARRRWQAAAPNLPSAPAPARARFLRFPLRRRAQRRLTRARASARPCDDARTRLVTLCVGSSSTWRARLALGKAPGARRQRRSDPTYRVISDVDRPGRPSVRLPTHPGEASVTLCVGSLPDGDGPDQALDEALRACRGCAMTLRIGSFAVSTAPGSALGEVPRACGRCAMTLRIGSSERS